jgi:hypothetical protein
MTAGGSSNSNGGHGHLSNRGRVFAAPASKLPLMNFMGDLWHHASNPSGFLSLGVSENVIFILCYDWPLRLFLFPRFSFLIEQSKTSYSSYLRQWNQ